MDYPSEPDYELEERRIEMGYDPGYPHILPPHMDDRLPSERGVWEWPGE